MFEDKEIRDIGNDAFGLALEVDSFIERYIHSDYDGSLLLSGKWGVGKTSFLNIVQSKINNKKCRTVKIEYWKNSTNINSQGYILKKISPWVYFSIAAFPFILTIVFAIIMGVLSLLKPEGDVSGVDILLWGVVASTVGVLNLSIPSFNMESVYDLVNKFIWWIYRVKKKKILLIFDDFDRLNYKEKNAVYPIFSDILKNPNVLVLVVGDYDILIKEKKDSLFVQKILGNIELMSENVDSKHVWEIFSINIEKEIEKEKIKPSDDDRMLFSEIKELFIQQERTMREQKMLFNQMKKIYFNKKINYVNFSEQLAMVYVFTFHYKQYQWIVKNKDRLCNINSTEQEAILNLAKADMGTQFDSIVFDFVFAIFNSQYKNSGIHPSIYNIEHFDNYRINIYMDGERHLTANQIEEIILEEKVEPIKSIFANEIKTREFISYLQRIGINNLEEKSLEALLVNLCFAFVESDFHSNSRTLFSSDPLERAIYIIIRDKNIDERKLLFNLIIADKRFDLSQKLFILPKFVKKNNQDTLQRGIVESLINKDNLVGLFENKKIKMIYMFYCTYRTNSDLDTIFDELLKLDNNRFYKILKKDFKSTIISTSGNYDVLYMQQIAYNSDFEKKLLSKIDELEEGKRAGLKEMIKEGQQW
ncbi:hypothetical protein HCA78_13240 [Listeria booriae]|uniref:KAP NTPase domain-containing protein n=1 Tax=Listeria booriae TaxID=1552123 RepID=A0A842D083_9LIST|nr:P-loop NTPase fold protein [Listeria booriae]MBC2004743.1 hypothetical protein [Listeria booriae]